LLLGVALAAVAWEAAVPLGWQFSRAFLPNKAMYFALGAASAAVMEDARVWPRFLAVLGVVMALCLMRDNSLKALAPLVWVLCLAAQFAQGRSARPWFGLRAFGVLLSSRPLCWLGAISYGMYLVNEPIQKLLGVLLTKAVDGEAMLFTLVWIPAAVLLPIAAAWWLHCQIETPALRRGKALAAAA
jgi:peptidoglycan/LPS O-acetylase OafA/YrhL